MKIYTVKDKEGILRPKVILELPLLTQAVLDGKIVNKDYGVQTVLDYIEKSKGEFKLAVCELTEI